MNKKFSKKLGIMLFVFTVFLLPYQSFAETINADTCTCGTDDDESVILKGHERLSYLNILEEDALFKNKISTKGVAKDTSQVIQMISSSKDSKVDEFILIVGTVKNSKKDGFYGIIDINTKEVKRITHLNVQHDQEIVHIYDYDFDGTLVYDFDFTFEEMENGTVEKKISEIKSVELNDNSLNKNPPKNPKDQWWWSWACNFTGVVACAAGCVAFIPIGLYGVCLTACSYFWGSSLC